MESKRSTMMIYAAIWILILGASATTIVSLTWWIEAGGMRQTDLQAQMIFDLDDEIFPQEQSAPGNLSTRGD